MTVTFATIGSGVVLSGYNGLATLLPYAKAHV